MRRIFTLLLIFTGLTCGLHTATAADMGVPVKAPSPEPALSWTGFYIGANGGAGWGTSESQADVGTFVNQLVTLNGGTSPSLVLSVPGPQVNYNGFLGGVDVGYDWQSGIFLFGIEGDFDGSSMKGNTECVLVFNCSVKHDWVADITGRLGLIAQNNVLLYVKGGWAWADSQYNIGNSITFGTPPTTLAANASASGTLGGGLLGVGAEYMITPNLFARLEYDHIEFENQTFGFGITTTPPITGLKIPNLNVTIHDSMNIVKGGIDYKFWSWAGF
jgi:outer membrane immunogenic protein